MKKYRLYTQSGTQIIESESISFKKTKNGLTVTPKGKKKIEGVLFLTEVQELESVVAVPNNFDDDEEV